MGPKYAVKYHTAAENALSHCYRSCLELLIDNGLQRSFFMQTEKVSSFYGLFHSSYVLFLVKPYLFVAGNVQYCNGLYLYRG